MIQDHLLASNFLGRDGFRWWLGQVAPSSAQGEQPKGGGWGNRVKVRIMGYHPFSKTELPDEDLPWCQCLLPATSGSGAAAMAENTKLRPGDVVFGFFLDGDNAQIPAIIGCFGKTDQVLAGDYSSPFVPFTGYNDNIKKPNGTLSPKETNQQNVNSAKSPRSVSTQTAKSIGNGEISYNSAIGQKTVFANTCSGTSTSGIINEVENLLDKIQNGAAAFLNIAHEIQKSVDKIAGIAQQFIGSMFNTVFNKLTPLLQKGLDLLYKDVFAKILAATRLPPIAHAAGVAAQTAMIKPVQFLEQAISCVAGKVAGGLGGIIKDLLSSLIQNVKNFNTQCAGDQFAGSFLNTLVNSIESGLSSALGGIATILKFVGGFSVGNVLRSAVSAISAIGGLFDCNQSSKSKCSSLVTQWTIGKGAKSANATDFNSILQNMQVANAVGNNSLDPFQQKYGAWDIFGPSSPTSPLGGCNTAPPSSCGPTQVKIFGGFGTGATGTVILGSAVLPGTKSKYGLLGGNVIGVKITNRGSGYVYPPFVEFYDYCNQGYGAVGRAVINDQGEVTGIYVVSTGENYPGVEDSPTAIVSNVEIDSAGIGYKTTDIVTDNFGNNYKIGISTSSGSITDISIINTSNEINDIPVISIKSDTGVGAILRPIVGINTNTIGSQVGVGVTILNIVDCVSS